MSDAPSAVSYAGSGAATMIGVLTFNEWVALFGLLLAAATFGVNLWFKGKHLKLAEREFEARNKAHNGTD